MHLVAFARRHVRILVGAFVVAGVLVRLGASPVDATVFCNTTAIVYTPPPSPTPAVQPLQPYPSNITVSGLAGTITDVNVSLFDITYTFPEDLDVLLVAPDGTSVLLMSDVGGDNLSENPTTDVDLTLDEQAPNALPADTQLVSGTYRPTDDDFDEAESFPTDAFPAPAPTPGGTSLTVLNGRVPNGTWSLYVVDDEPGPNTVQDIGGGWCIDLLTTGGATTSTTASSTTSTTLGPTTTTTSPTTTTTVPATTTTTVSPTTTTTQSPTTTTTTALANCASPPPATIVAQPGTVTQGTSGNDVIYGTSGNDRIFGGGGNDVIVGFAGNDQLSGGSGNDTICGGDGSDQISGDEAHDQLYGDAGDDTISGGSGNDHLVGGTGADRLSGGEGNDSCTPGSQAGDAAAPPPSCDTIS